MRTASLWLALTTSACTLYFGPDNGDGTGSGSGANHAPAADPLIAHGDYGAYTVQVRGNVHDADGDTVACSFDAGDGLPPVDFLGCATVPVGVGHVYGAAGTYHAILHMTDARGATADAPLTIHIPFDPPIAFVTPEYERSTLLGAPNAIAWNGARLATGDSQRVSFWDPATGTRIGGWDIGTVWALAWSPDGQYVAVTVGDRYTATSSIRLAANGAKLMDLGDATAFAWSPDSSELAVGGEAGDLHVIRLDGTQVANLTGHTGAIIALSWNKFGELASGGDDHNVFLWQPDTGGFGSEIAAWREGPGVNDLAWSPDGNTLAVGSPYFLSFYDHLGAGKGSVFYEDDERIAWSADGTKIAAIGGSSDHTVRIHDVTGGQGTILTGPSASLGAIAWSPDGSTLAVTSSDVAVRLWDPAAATVRRAITRMPEADALAWSPDGAHLAIAGMPQVDILDAATGSTVATASDVASAYNQTVAWSPDSARVAYPISYAQLGQLDLAAGDGGHAWLGEDYQRISWNAKNWVAVGSSRQLTVWYGDGGGLIRDFGAASAISVSWAPDGALATTDGYQAYGWDVVSGTVSATYNCEASPLAVAWSPSGDTLAISGRGGTCLWPRGALHESATLVAGGDQVVWDPLGGKLAFGDTTADHWTIVNADGTPAVDVAGGGHGVWAPDGQHLAVGDPLGRVVVYHVYYAP